jgi:hypothetical protein
MDCEIAGVPPADTWTAISPLLKKIHPAPVPGAPISFLRKEACASAGVTPSQLWACALATGYGVAAEIATKWVLDGAPLTPAQTVDLSAWAAGRAALMMRVLGAALHTGGAFTDLFKKDIYELLDPSEKRLVSYLAGSSMAGAVGPQAVRVRTGHSIRRLFHESMCRVHARIFDTITINTAGAGKPDFIGLDEDYAVHIFEAKGDLDGPGYRELSQGAAQIAGVMNVTVGTPGVVVIPRSRNVCLTFLSSDPVPLKRPGKTSLVVAPNLRVAVVHLKASAEPATGEPPPAMRTLALEVGGLDLFGLWLILSGARRIPLDDELTRFQFESGFEVCLSGRVFQAIEARVAPLQGQGDSVLWPERHELLPLLQSVVRKLGRLTEVLERFPTVAPKPQLGYVRTIAHPFAFVRAGDDDVPRGPFDQQRQ